MAREGTLFRNLRVIRTAGIISMAVMVLAGRPEPVAADECWDYVISCTQVNDCVARLHDPCYQPGECEGGIKCYPKELYTDCYESEEPVAMVCDYEEET